MRLTLLFSFFFMATTQASYAQFTQAYSGALKIFERIHANEELNLFMNRYMKVYYDKYVGN